MARRPTSAASAASPSDSPPDDAPAPLPLSRGKRLAFTAAMLLLPLVLLGLVEGALRVSGVGRDLPLFETFASDPRYRVMSRDVAHRYFYTLKSVPNGLGDFFATEKAPGTLRVVVMGESSAAGFPFYYGAAFSRQLAQRLQQTFPDRKVEVVNTAMAAISSYTLRDFADEVVAIQPDAVLVYAGHNEYYGALGVGSSESLGRSPAFVSLYLRLQRFRTVQALRGLIQRVMSASEVTPATAADGATLMERMVGEQRIANGSDLDRAGDRQLAANIGALLETMQTAGIPVFVGTLASNERDQPPFISAPADGVDVARWQARVDAAAGNAAALAALAREDTLDANVRFALGRALAALGDSAGARDAYRAARDRDRLRFRAPSRFNQVLRRLAAAHGATVVESEAALSAASPGGIIGHEMMVEHLHPTPDGYFVLADAFYGALRAARLGGDYGPGVSRAEARAERLLTPVDSLVGAMRILQLKATWPFQPPGVRAPYLDTLQRRTALDSIARDLFDQRVSWPEANEAQRLYYVRTDDLTGALRVAFAAIQEYPFSEGVYRAAGQLLVDARRYRDALPYFEQALAREETADGRASLGALKLALGDAKGAIPDLEAAVRLAPNAATAHYNLAGAYATQQRWAEASASVAIAARLAPERADVRELRAQIDAHR